MGYKKNIKTKEKKVGNYSIILGQKRLTKDKTEWMKKTRNELIYCRNKYEKELGAILKKEFEGITIQQPFCIEGKMYFADFAILDLNIIIEVDGDYHKSENQILKDKKRDDRFKKIGFEVIRIDNKDVSVGECVDSIRRHIHYLIHKKAISS